MAVEPSIVQVILGHKSVNRICFTKHLVVLGDSIVGRRILSAILPSAPEVIQTRGPCHGNCQKAPEADTRWPTATAADPGKRIVVYNPD